MRKLVPILIMLILVAAFAAVASADGQKPVQYTFTFSDLGAGAHGGGPLYADGSAGGNWTLSVFNGQNVTRINVVSWSYVVPGESIDICVETTVIKGAPLLPPFFCTAALGLPLSIDGTPAVISNPRGDLAIVRVTPAN